MNEYISKEFMLKNLEDDKMNNVEHCEPVTIQIMERFIRYVKEFPAADVQPVKHGRWSECCTDSVHYSGICTACKSASVRQLIEKPYEFCPRCGARMDGKWFKHK